MQDPSTMVVIITACVLGAAVLSSLNSAVIALGEGRLQLLAKEGGSLARTATRLLSQKTAFQIRFLVGRVMLLATAVGLAVHTLPSGGVWIVVVVLGVALADGMMAAVLSRVVRRKAERWILPVVKWLWPVEWLAGVVAWPAVAAANLFDKFAHKRDGGAPDRLSAIDVESVIDQSELSGILSQDHAEMLRSILEFRETITREVMVPRTQVVAIKLSTPIDEVVELVIDKGHSRYPVYGDRLDQVEGLLYAKDLFRALRERSSQELDLSRIIRKPVYFVPESKKIGVLLREMQARRFHLAVVVDEFGGTSGIVTLEDILEEIVGEIRDEHDREDAPVKMIAPDIYVANASVSVYDLEDFIGVELPKADGEYESVGGMLTDVAGMVPGIGESVQVGDLVFTVRDADKRHVTRVEIKRIQPD